MVALFDGGLALNQGWPGNSRSYEIGGVLNITASEKLLSICIPTFDRSNLLARSLQSVLDDEFPWDTVEVVVLDNASRDDTGRVVERVLSRNSHVRYVRNDFNAGHDRNTLKAIEVAVGDYVFLFSDDDVLVPGSAAEILTAIETVRPSFLYLNHAGFWEDESPNVVISRQAELHAENQVYESGFKFLYDWLLEHASAMVFRTSVARHALRRMGEYEQFKFERGYAASALAYQVALEATGPFVKVGHCCVAVRNTLQPSYNPIYSSHIDPVRQFEVLFSWGLLTRTQFSRLMKKRIWGFRDNLILALRCAGDPRYSAIERRIIWKQNWRYWRFYLYLAPVVTLPRWIVCPVYRLGQWVLRRYERFRKVRRRVFDNA